MRRFPKQTWYNLALFALIVVLVQAGVTYVPGTSFGPQFAQVSGTTGGTKHPVCIEWKKKVDEAKKKLGRTPPPAPTCTASSPKGPVIGRCQLSELCLALKTPDGKDIPAKPTDPEEEQKKFNKYISELEKSFEENKLPTAEQKTPSPTEVPEGTEELREKKTAEQPKPAGEKLPSTAQLQKLAGTETETPTTEKRNTWQEVKDKFVQLFVGGEKAPVASLGDVPPPPQDVPQPKTNFVGEEPYQPPASTFGKTEQPEAPEKRQTWGEWAREKIFGASEPKPIAEVPEGVKTNPYLTNPETNSSAYNNPNALTQTYVTDPKVAERTPEGGATDPRFAPERPLTPGATLEAIKENNEIIKYANEIAAQHTDYCFANSCYIDNKGNIRFDDPKAAEPFKEINERYNRIAPLAREAITENKDLIDHFKRVWTPEEQMKVALSDQRIDEFVKQYEAEQRKAALERQMETKEYPFLQKYFGLTPEQIEQRAIENKIIEDSNKKVTQIERVQTCFETGVCNREVAERILKTPTTPFEVAQRNELLNTIDRWGDANERYQRALERALPLGERDPSQIGPADDRRKIFSDVEVERRIAAERVRDFAGNTVSEQTRKFLENRVNPGLYSQFSEFLHKQAEQYALYGSGPTGPSLMEKYVNPPALLVGITDPIANTLGYPTPAQEFNALFRTAETNSFLRGVDVALTAGIVAGPGLSLTERIAARLGYEVQLLPRTAIESGVTPKVETPGGFENPFRYTVETPKIEYGTPKFVVTENPEFVTATNPTGRVIQQIDTGLPPATAGEITSGRTIPAETRPGPIAGETTPAPSPTTPRAAPEVPVIEAPPTAPTQLTPGQKAELVGDIVTRGCVGFTMCFNAGVTAERTAAITAERAAIVEKAPVNTGPGTQTPLPKTTSEVPPPRTAAPVETPVPKTLNVTVTPLVIPAPGFQHPSPFTNNLTSAPAWTNDPGTPYIENAPTPAPIPQAPLAQAPTLTTVSPVDISTEPMPVSNTGSQITAQTPGSEITGTIAPEPASPTRVETPAPQEQTLGRPPESNRGTWVSGGPGIFDVGPSDYFKNVGRYVQDFFTPTPANQLAPVIPGEYSPIAQLNQALSQQLANPKAGPERVTAAVNKLAQVGLTIDPSGKTIIRESTKEVVGVQVPAGEPQAGYYRTRREDIYPGATSVNGTTLLRPSNALPGIGAGTIVSYRPTAAPAIPAAPAYSQFPSNFWSVEFTTYATPEQIEAAIRAAQDAVLGRGQTTPTPQTTPSTPSPAAPSGVTPALAQTPSDLPETIDPEAPALLPTPTPERIARETMVNDMNMPSSAPTETSPTPAPQKPSPSLQSTEQTPQTETPGFWKRVGDRIAGLFGRTTRAPAPSTPAVTSPAQPTPTIARTPESTPTNQPQIQTPATQAPEQDRFFVNEEGTQVVHADKVGEDLRQVYNSPQMEVLAFLQYQLEQGDTLSEKETLRLVSALESYIVDKTGKVPSLVPFDTETVRWLLSTPGQLIPELKRSVADQVLGEMYGSVDNIPVVGRPGSPSVDVLSDLFRDFNSEHSPTQVRDLSADAQRILADTVLQRPQPSVQAETAQSTPQPAETRIAVSKVQYETIERYRKAFEQVRKPVDDSIQLSDQQRDFMEWLLLDNQDIVGIYDAHWRVKDPFAEPFKIQPLYPIDARKPNNPNMLPEVIEFDFKNNPSDAYVVKMFRQAELVTARRLLAEARLDFDASKNIVNRENVVVARRVGGAQTPRYETLGVSAEKPLTDEPVGQAFHGSPHDFLEFDYTKIGTGEGAQTYTHGLYVASNRLTAEFYQEKLSNSGEGHMYTVRVVAPENTFLDFESSLASQTNHVKQALSRVFGEQFVQKFGFVTVDDLISFAINGMGIESKALSDQLYLAGISGMRYLDQGSRGVLPDSEKTYNYVLYSDRIVRVAEKDGVALGVAIPVLLPDGTVSSISSSFGAVSGTMRALGFALSLLATEPIFGGPTVSHFAPSFSQALAQVATPIPGTRLSIGQPQRLTASYYDKAGKDRHTPNRNTASGSVYTGTQISVALNTLNGRTVPLGSVVEIKNLTNGKTMYAVVNDRMDRRYNGKRIDLSPTVRNSIGASTLHPVQVRLVALPTQYRYKAGRTDYVAGLKPSDVANIKLAVNGATPTTIASVAKIIPLPPSFTPGATPAPVTPIPRTATTPAPRTPVPYASSLLGKVSIAVRAPQPAEVKMQNPVPGAQVTDPILKQLQATPAIPEQVRTRIVATEKTPAGWRVNDQTQPFYGDVFQVTQGAPATEAEAKKIADQVKKLVTRGVTLPFVVADPADMLNPARNITVWTPEAIVLDQKLRAVGLPGLSPAYTRHTGPSRELDGQGFNKFDSRANAEQIANALVNASKPIDGTNRRVFTLANNDALQQLLTSLPGAESTDVRINQALHPNQNYVARDALRTLILAGKLLGQTDMGYILAATEFGHSSHTLGYDIDFGTGPSALAQNSQWRQANTFSTIGGNALATQFASFAVANNLLGEGRLRAGVYPSPSGHIGVVPGEEGSKIWNMGNPLARARTGPLKIISDHYVNETTGEITFTQFVQLRDAGIYKRGENGNPQYVFLYYSPEIKNSSLFALNTPTTPASPETPMIATKPTIPERVVSIVQSLPFIRSLNEPYVPALEEIVVAQPEVGKLPERTLPVGPEVARTQTPGVKDVVVAAAPEDKKPAAGETTIVTTEPGPGRVPETRTPEVPTAVAQLPEGRTPERNTPVGSNRVPALEEIIVLSPVEVKLPAPVVTQAPQTPTTAQAPKSQQTPVAAPDVAPEALAALDKKITDAQAKLDATRTQIRAISTQQRSISVIAGRINSAAAALNVVKQAITKLEAPTEAGKAVIKTGISATRTLPSLLRELAKTPGITPEQAANLRAHADKVTGLVTKLNAMQGKEGAALLAPANEVVAAGEPIIGPLRSTVANVQGGIQKALQTQTAAENGVKKEIAGLQKERKTLLAATPIKEPTLASGHLFTPFNAAILKQNFTSVRFSMNYTPNPLANPPRNIIATIKRVPIAPEIDPNAPLEASPITPVEVAELPPARDLRPFTERAVDYIAALQNLPVRENVQGATEGARQVAARFGTWMNAQLALSKAKLEQQQVAFQTARELDATQRLPDELKEIGVEIVRMTKGKVSLSSIAEPTNDDVSKHLAQNLRRRFLTAVPLSVDEELQVFKRIKDELAKYPPEYWQVAKQVNIFTSNLNGALQLLGTTNPHLGYLWVNASEKDILVTLHHELGGHINEDLLPNPQNWAESLYGSQAAKKYREIISSNIPPALRLEGFSSNYAGGQVGEDIAETLAFMFANYPKLKEAAAYDPTLATKIRMIQQSLLLASNGKMNEAYWNALKPIDSQLKLDPLHKPNFALSVQQGIWKLGLNPPGTRVTYAPPNIAVTQIPVAAPSARTTETTAKETAAEKPATQPQNTTAQLPSDTTTRLEGPQTSETNISQAPLSPQVPETSRVGVTTRRPEGELSQGEALPDTPEGDQTPIQVTEVQPTPALEVPKQGEEVERQLEWLRNLGQSIAAIPGRIRRSVSNLIARIPSAPEPTFQEPVAEAPAPTSEKPIETPRVAREEPTPEAESPRVAEQTPKPDVPKTDTTPTTPAAEMAPTPVVAREEIPAPTNESTPAPANESVARTPGVEKEFSFRTGTMTYYDTLTGKPFMERKGTEFPVLVMEGRRFQTSPSILNDEWIDVLDQMAVGRPDIYEAFEVEFFGRGVPVRSLELFDSETGGTVVATTVFNARIEVEKIVFQFVRDIGYQSFGIDRINEEINSFTDGKVSIDSPSVFPKNSNALEAKDYPERLTPLPIEEHVEVVRELQKQVEKYTKTYWENSNTVHVSIFRSFPRTDVPALGLNKGTAFRDGNFMWVESGLGNEQFARDFHHELQHINNAWFPDFAVWTKKFGLTAPLAQYDRPTGFASAYGTTKPDEDKATIVEAMFYDYGELEQIAANDPVLAEKIRVIKEALYIMSNGEMDENYWKNLTPIRPQRRTTLADLFGGTETPARIPPSERTPEIAPEAAPSIVPHNPFAPPTYQLSQFTSPIVLILEPTPITGVEPPSSYPPGSPIGTAPSGGTPPPPANDNAPVIGLPDWMKRAAVFITGGSLVGLGDNQKTEEEPQDEQEITGTPAAEKKTEKKENITMVKVKPSNEPLDPNVIFSGAIVNPAPFTKYLPVGPQPGVPVRIEGPTPPVKISPTKVVEPPNTIFGPGPIPTEPQGPSTPGKVTPQTTPRPTTTPPPQIPPSRTPTTPEIRTPDTTTQTTNKGVGWLSSLGQMFGSLFGALFTQQNQLPTPTPTPAQQQPAQPPSSSSTSSSSPATQPGAVAFFPSPRSVQEKGTAQLIWSSVETLGCSITDDTGKTLVTNKKDGTYRTEPLTKTTLFTIECSVLGKPAIKATTSVEVLK